MIDQLSALIHFLLHLIPLGILIGGLTFIFGLVSAFLLFRSSEADCGEREEKARQMESRRKLLQDDCISIEKSLKDLDVELEEGGIAG